MVRNGDGTGPGVVARPATALIAARASASACQSVVPVPPLWRRIPEWCVAIPPCPEAGPPSPEFWWLSAHGGAGVTTLTAAVTGSGDARRAWPAGFGQSPYVVVVCRAHLAGLARARDLACQHAAGLAPPEVVLLGLVVVADGPGAVPKPVRRMTTLVSGAFPRLWWVDWVAQWRNTAPTPNSALPPSVRRLTEDLSQLVAPRTP